MECLFLCLEWDCDFFFDLECDLDFDLLKYEYFIYLIVSDLFEIGLLKIYKINFNLYFDL